MLKENDPLNTPMMIQYQEIKNKFPDSILFFRMGDFYEMFLEDAVTASSILDITLTKRQNSIPMCGIPYHSKDPYISKLLNSGQKIVICEQSEVSDEKKKIMNREVVRIITPGTVVEENFLPSTQNNFLLILLNENIHLSLGFIDVSTSEYYFFKIHMEDREKLTSLINKFNPKEACIFEYDLSGFKEIFNLLYIHISTLKKEEMSFVLTQDSNENIKKITRFYLEKNYFNNTFIINEKKISFNEFDQFLEMDRETVKNLDLIENEIESTHTLYSILNFCVTAKGKRILKNRILFPVRDEQIIQERWRKILALNEIDLKSLKDQLIGVYDLERVISRFRLNKAFPRDFKAILETFEKLILVKSILKTSSYHLKFEEEKIQNLISFLQDRIWEGELPTLLGNGSFIKVGFSEKIDKAREAKSNGKDWILDVEQKEKKRTGLNTLKIKYNKILGYYIEISRLQAKSVPMEYFKKQTLVTTERFTCKELEEIERIILEADETLETCEKEIFNEMIQEVLNHSQIIYDVMELLGELDFIRSLVEVKEKYNWIKPIINHNRLLKLENSRHPVVEAFLPIGQEFVPNDVLLDPSKNSIAILTGPNMAGKSTYMRQIALAQILFQMGSFVPVSFGNFSIVDKLFTRIGSGDNLTLGESTFFLEMKETAHILNTMTEHSLILFDEVGRGTSTYDGISLAWAILEYLSSAPKKIKTIFATHYHELTSLSKLDGIFNLYLDTIEKENRVVFLKKVKEGKSKKSFGIYVAELAGIPTQIVNRSRIILKELESGKKEIRVVEEERSLFSFDLLVETKKNQYEMIQKLLNTVNINDTPPIKALQILEELKKLIE